ncbi:bifunctional ADP-dependent NAD(P)H-hydrate dehydratase/NAD(P)H-hydrate epimerase [bacterium (Candidatus Blackallbacteria) CG17_big_fil_post_rev_8_21_14_2_50_48_46]|uniref:Bifunctional NAD(P)H-hydrate repair enzyme n=1 Tax=bacterium (Candidatus Blackallbacteria) CG17_big_fil_post_rev_8_21_14_2_50_48_46 TaxID=2014261 RepID=A0A2M7FY64_9BACT|nr:MAG: bifunctional ADP-dependent NAD(P)H-hydrate dehydratase/NAD(P)H-hydrate epimerase [bacterium (Candidatus Blackallbacteria) CG18_big_fil_WC_8_21_14_2_50_49_26]PIW14243.1 MAG: bifunctional ADP-dependent NAD(P)H-hydrate dehydratase/NAD(P)H-hydrate epimerase [bacterium (Candidatus Blackallbacteria) CG17_big_fil_post_rev_8_21_14_2_50_48_46]PIW46952.1 MAG: bifunctional ADP-dependent NAD(P)H-hydrate dehydratase/NAD(P)H-hydrate epimerase [bacterium (Candidatus Blackallbacteria) CG13_big_fil_rev_8_
MRIVSVETMQGLDQRTIQELGLPSLVLMERAALGVLTALREHFSPALQQVHILVGSGNNGGDGLALARMLQGQGIPVEIWIQEETSKRSPDNLKQLEIVKKLGLPVHPLEANPTWRTQLSEATLIIDSIFGVGLSRPISGIWAEVIQYLNQVPLPIVAIDIPSGIHGDSGVPLGDLALRAELTVTCGLPKWGLMMDPALDYTGQLEMVDIGIPPAYSAAVPGGHLLDLPLAASLAPPPRRRNSHKGSYGRLVIVAGSLGMSGAAVIATEAALKAGTGLVYTCVPASIQAQVAQQVPQALVVPLPDSDGFLGPESLEHLRTLLLRADAALLGPGLGFAPQTTELVQKLLCAMPCPLVLDADGLNHFAQTSQDFQSPTLITPHAGELGRLLQTSTAEIQANRLQALHQGANQFNCTHILKGARSLIGTPDGRCWVNTSGNPALARGGSGDILAGLLAGLLAQGYPPEAAALLGVYWHGLAADLAVTEWPEACVSIRELLTCLPKALARLQQI